MDKFEIPTAANATSFGETGNNAQGAMVASSTRRLVVTPLHLHHNNVLPYFSSDGGVFDFGELTVSI